MYYCYTHSVIQKEVNQLFGGKIPESTTEMKAKVEVKARVKAEVKARVMAKVKARGRVFNQFDPRDDERLRKFLKTITVEGKLDLKKAIGLCQQAVASGESPLLVKVALSIFLTHSKEAHRLGVIAPSLQHYSEFLPVEGVPLSNPTTQDTMQGYGILSYWREDYDFNDHHNHWHEVYPTSGVGDPVHSTIDRQGELFLYMHAQMIARYNAELTSWGLDAVPAFQYDDVLSDGYVPTPSLTLEFLPRPANRGWDEPTKAIQITARDNIFGAIHDGYFVTKKVNDDGDKIGTGRLILTPENAKNWVGVVVEAQSEALQEVCPGEFIDRDLYGNLHNMGHNYFSRIGSEPDGNVGVMSSVLVAIRDPVFWFWHRHIDEFRRVLVKKHTHSVDEFKPEAELEMVKLVPQNSPQEEDSSGYVHIKTSLGSPQLELNEVNAKVDHEPYQWEITIKSTKQPPPTAAEPQEVTVRLFIVPEGQQEDQNAWIEMDKFTQTLCSAESTTATRSDLESAVARQVDGTMWCKCGWPQNMMLPVGTPEGMPFIALAMLTESHLSEVCHTDLSLVPRHVV